MGGRPRATGRVSALIQEDVEASNNVVSGILAVNLAFAHALFDSGASDSFISTTFAQKYNFPHVPLEEELCVSAPTGSEIIVDRKCENRPVTIEGREFLADLIIMDIRDFDVILGMDWLSAHYATLDCRKKLVDFRIPSQPKFSFVGNRAYLSPNIISTKPPS